MQEPEAAFLLKILEGMVDMMQDVVNQRYEEAHVKAQTLIEQLNKIKIEE